MLTPCNCDKAGFEYTPAEYARIMHLPVCPTTVSAMADRLDTHGRILNGRRYIAKCKHNERVFAGETKRTEKHNPVFINPLQEAFL